jgi:hypothetical protein
MYDDGRSGMRMGSKATDCIFTSGKCWLSTGLAYYLDNVVKLIGSDLFQGASKDIMSGIGHILISCLHIRCG